MAWQATSVGEIYDADEGAVVYFDPRSGDTHLISAFAACVVELLRSRALTISELTKELSPLIEEENSGEAEQSISKVLQELVELDILKQG